jgi:hypothetical protein
MSDKKGKPTPKRKEAQAKLKMSPLSPSASKEAKKALKAQARVRRLETRAAYIEIKDLPAGLLEIMLMSANQLLNTF